MRQKRIPIIEAIAFFLALTVAAIFPVGVIYASGPVESPDRMPGFEWRFGTGARSLPLGAAVVAEAGFDQPLWGDWQNKENFLYGFARPAIRWTTSGTINSIDTFFSLYPVSFLTITLGRYHDFRNVSESASADCDRVQCGGVIKGDYGALDFTISYRSAVLSSHIDQSDYRISDQSKGFFEEGSAVVGNPGHDNFISQSHTLGLQIASSQIRDLFVGSNYRRTEAQLSKNSSQRAVLVLSHSWKEKKVTYAAGLYESTIQARGATVAVQLEWVPQQGLLLF